MPKVWKAASDTGGQSREFLHGNVKFNFDHCRVVYRCTVCGNEEEHADLKR